MFYRIGRKKCAYGLVWMNALANILIAIIVNVDLSNEAKITIYAIIRLFNGLTSTLYSTAVVLGRLFWVIFNDIFKKSILFKRWKLWVQSIGCLPQIQYIIFIYLENFWQSVWATLSEIITIYSFVLQQLLVVSLYTFGTKSFIRQKIKYCRRNLFVFLKKGWFPNLLVGNSRVVKTSKHITL